MAKISIMGAGSWGSALARILGDNGNDVLIYDVDKNIEAVNKAIDAVFKQLVKTSSGR